MTYFIILDRKNPEFFIYFPIVALVRLMECPRKAEKGCKTVVFFKKQAGISYLIVHVFNYNEPDVRRVLIRFDKILRNEKDTGRVLLQKTINTGVSQIENNGRMDRYLYTSIYEAIISDRVLMSAQEEKYRRSKTLERSFTMKCSLLKFCVTVAS